LDQRPKGEVLCFEEKKRRKKEIRKERKAEE
jgi:hypothetical protein